MKNGVGAAFRHVIGIDFTRAWAGLVEDAKLCKGCLVVHLDEHDVCLRIPRLRLPS